MSDSLVPDGISSDVAVLAIAWDMVVRTHYISVCSDEKEASEELDRIVQAFIRARKQIADSLQPTS